MKPFELDMPTGRRAAYDGRINSEEWAAVRDEVLFRDGNKCQICGCKRTLQVHHLSYDNFMDTDELVTLCKPCHEIITKAVTTARELEASVDLPKTLKVARWHEEESRVVGKIETAMCRAYRDFLVETILELWKRSLKSDSTVNLKELNAMENAGFIINSSVEGQTWMRSFGDIHYVTAAIDRISEYTAQAYDHYASEGMSDSEFARMFKIKPGNVWKVKRNAEKLRSGGEDGR